MKFSPDSHYLVAGGRDGNVRVFDTTNGTVVADFQQHKRRVNALAFSPDGSLLATGSDDQTVCIWSMQSLKLVKTYQYPSGKVRSLTFCGPELVAAGSANNTICIWNVNGDNAPVYTMDEHKGTVAELVWDASRNVLVSCGFDSTIRFWKFDNNTDVANAPVSIIR